MAKRRLFFYSYCLFLSGCLFSSDEAKDTCVVGSYYVSSFYDNITLLYKSDGDLKLLGSGTVIAKDIDSIGHYQNYLFAKTKTEYFIFDTATKIFEGRYDIYSSFIAAKTRLGLHSEMKSAGN